MKWSASVSAMLVVLLGCAGQAVQGQDRGDLVDRARLEFSDSASVQLLFTAANPSTAARDSLWAVAVYELAGALLRLDDSANASVWFSWAARHGADWPIDRGYFPPSVLSAYDLVVPTVDDAAVREPESVVTSWSWPSVLDWGAMGALAVAPSDATARVTVSVAGMGVATVGDDLSLAPGTYEIVASADGYESATVTREVLPGAATRLAFDLVAEGGPFPWKWVGAGAAAAGVLVATLSGGGGGEPPPPGTTGGIIVGLPDGWGR